MQLRKEEERRSVQFYGSEKTAYLAPTPAYGTTTAVPEPEMRSRYISSSHMIPRSASYMEPRSNAVTMAEPRANEVALATPVDVGYPGTPAGVTHSGTSLSSLEQEILDRERRTSAVPLIHRG